jgi:hypothetical protein
MTRTETGGPGRKEISDASRPAAPQARARHDNMVRPDIAAPARRAIEVP